MAKMSFTEVVRMMRKEYNVRLQRDIYGEYRVNLLEQRGGHYFTNDINDAIETGKRMRAEARLSVYSVRFTEPMDLTLVTYGGTRIVCSNRLTNGPCGNTIGSVDSTWNAKPVSAKHTD